MNNNERRIFLREWRNEVILHGGPKAKAQRLVGFSFDDGPHPVITPKILDILEKNRLSATFFWIAKNATSLEDEDKGLFEKIVKRVKDAGCEIGYHGPQDYVPDVRTRLFGAFSRKELADGKNKLEEVTGMQVKLFRPHGVQLGNSINAATEMDLKVVMGDLFPYAQPTWPPKVQINRFLSARPADILIFHDGYSKRRNVNDIEEILPIVIKKLHSKGLKPLSVLRMLKRDKY